MQSSLWIPLFIIFASALLGAIVKRYTRDHCLKAFHGSFVCLKLKNGNWVAGDLTVYSNCLELEYRKAQLLHQTYVKLTYILYEHDLDGIDRLLRPSPRPGTEERRHWEREIRRLQHPSPMRRARRKIRNLFNMLRDAFAQSLTLIFGVVKTRARLGTTPLDDARIGEMSKSIVSVVPNAYEPILEKYLGHLTLVQTPQPDGQPIEQVGTLQEYSSKYLLVRDVNLLPEIPREIVNEHNFDNQFDVIFPRPVNVLRHLTELRK